MRCSQCGKEFSDNKFREYTIDDTVRRSCVCKVCEKFNDMVDNAYVANPKTEAQLNMIDAATDVYIHQVRSGFKPRGKLARLVRNEIAKKDFFEEYVKANTPKEAK